MKLDALLEYIKKLKTNDFTGQIRINFHKGNISSRIEKKTCLSENDLEWYNVQKNVIPTKI